MAYDFDRVIDRSGTDATKLQKYAGTDILPFWIADMDFAVPDFILDPLRERLEHPIIGYTKKPDSLPLTLRLYRLPKVEIPHRSIPAEIEQQSLHRSRRA